MVRRAEISQRSERLAKVATTDFNRRNNQEICELTWVGLMQTERDPIDKLIDNKSLICIIINSIGNVFRFSLNARILHERLHKRK
jgi:hypothetical protein